MGTFFLRGRDSGFHCRAQGLLAEFAEKMSHRELVPRDPLSERANISFNHQVCKLAVKACSVQLSVPPLSKAYLPSTFASLKCNHRLPPRNSNTPIGFPRARGPLLDSPAAILPSHTHTVNTKQGKAWVKQKWRPDKGLLGRTANPLGRD